MAQPVTRTLTSGYLKVPTRDFSLYQSYHFIDRDQNIMHELLVVTFWLYYFGKRYDYKIFDLVHFGLRYLVIGFGYTW